MEKLCRALFVSRGSYYAWLARGQSRRMRRDQALASVLVGLHEKYPALGLDSLFHLLQPNFGCSRERVHRLMRQYGVHSIRKRAYKATTNSRHSHPIASDLLKRQFYFEQSNKVWWAISLTSQPPRAGFISLS